MLLDSTATLYVVRFCSLISSSLIQNEEQILICSACNAIMHPFAFLKHALSQYISHVQNSSAISTKSFELFFTKIIFPTNGKNYGPWSTWKVTQANHDGLKMWLGLLVYGSDKIYGIQGEDKMFSKRSVRIIFTTWVLCWSKGKELA